MGFDITGFYCPDHDANPLRAHKVGSTLALLPLDGLTFKQIWPYTENQIEIRPFSTTIFKLPGITHSAAGSKYSTCSLSAH